MRNSLSRSGLNPMWILKKSKELFEDLKSPNFNHITSIKSFDSIYPPFKQLFLATNWKNRLASNIRNSFIFINGYRRYTYLDFGNEEAYFVKEHSDSKHKYSEDGSIKILEFLVDSIFVVFTGKVLKRIVGIPIATKCTIFLYSYEAECIQTLLSTDRKQLASRFNST